MKQMMLAMLISVSTVLGGCGNEILAIENNNNYRWQRFMNDQEFEKITEGMRYMDVVKIAGGAGEKQNDNTYLWHDELLITRGYEIVFIDDKVTEKSIVELHGAVKEADDAK
ncbi:MAG TPA: hypothetical protein K8V30_05595 [Metalysinibacillus jejuensis]|uniref:Uncharacterized protein n=1 Tax=Metalysinibacillus jejuensis TaxID=914327 RepID=A0A921T4N4_9BACL|nr:hypothetical protein [Metalysinibacillus jejuensis]